MCIAMCLKNQEFQPDCGNKICVNKKKYVLFINVLKKSLNCFQIILIYAGNTRNCFIRTSKLHLERDKPINLLQHS